MEGPVIPRCSFCGGSGTCPACNGASEGPSMNKKGKMEWADCKYCKGSGRCEACNGKGRVEGP